MRRNTTRLVLLLTLILPSSSAFGHDVWFTTVQDSTSLRILVNHGHPGDRKRPDPDKLFHLSIHGGDGHPSWLPSLRSIEDDHMPVLMSDPLPIGDEPALWLVGAEYDNGYWVKTTEGYRNTSHNRVPTADDSLSSLKCAKVLISIHGGQSEVYKKVLGYPLELVPLANPFFLKNGEPWSVQVLWDGRPLAGVAVEATDGITPMNEDAIPRYQTNEQGVASIPMNRSGPLLLVVDYQRPGRHPDEATVDRYNATFHVTLPTF